MQMPAILVALAIPLTVSAAETNRDEVLQVAVKTVVQTTQHQHQYPFIISATTSPGAERFISQFLARNLGTAIGEELSADFDARNRSANDLQISTQAPLQVRDLAKYQVGDNYDWNALAQAYPHVPAVVRLSEPGFDHLSSYAVVRVDLFTRDHATTQVITLQHQPSGGWKTGQMAMGLYEPMHRTDISLHPPSGH